MRQRRAGSTSRSGATARAAPRRATRAASVATIAPRLALGCTAGYLGVLTVAAWRAVAAGAACTPIAAAPRHRFVVLVPAHDEEHLIGRTLESLATLDYPPTMVAVHVVADNCRDATAAIVRDHGVEVHERHSPDGGKGPALQWLLGRLRDRGDAFDAVVIVDADTTVDAGFLAVMDATLSAGATVVQAYYAVHEPTSTTAAFRSAALAARHYLRPLGRNRVGGSSGLFGNGMVFAAEVLDQHEWTNHLTEDIELQLELLLAGTRVRFAPDAVVAAEMPATIEASTSQHERWERGRMDMARRFLGPLLRRAVTGGPAGRVAYADAAADQLVPPFSIVVLATVGWGAAAVVRTVAGAGSTAAKRDLVAAGAVSALQAAYVLSALRLVGAPASTYRSLAAAPRLVLWKLGLWTKVLRRGEAVTWTRTKRNAEADRHASVPVFTDPSRS